MMSSRLPAVLNSIGQQTRSLSIPTRAQYANVERLIILPDKPNVVGNLTAEKEKTL